MCIIIIRIIIIIIIFYSINKIINVVIKHDFHEILITILNWILYYFEGFNTHRVNRCRMNTTGYAGMCRYVCVCVSVMAIIPLTLTIQEGKQEGKWKILQVGQMTKTFIVLFVMIWGQMYVEGCPPYDGANTGRHNGRTLFAFNQLHYGVFDVICTYLHISFCTL